MDVDIAWNKLLSGCSCRNRTNPTRLDPIESFKNSTNAEQSQDIALVLEIMV